MRRTATHNKGLNAMGAEVVNSSFVILLSFGGLLNICASISPTASSPNRWQKILNSVVGKSLADRKLNLARKLKKRLAY